MPTTPRRAQELLSREISTRQLMKIAKRKFGLLDREIIASYLKQNTVRKLHIGCGGHLLEGWLNSDYYPASSSDILHLDAIQRFPFDGGEFDFLFSEHMIEHVPYSQGCLMLNECFRVLKPNGVLRLSTPDLFFLIRLCSENKSEVEHRYIEWITKTCISYAPYSDAAFVVNNFVHDWGHQFIYDEKTLRLALQRVGFAKIKRCELNQSDHDALKNLENEKRMPDGFLKLETLTLEATKSS
jgi:predicted SAM-dependent methyltransferase